MGTDRARGLSKLKNCKFCNREFFTSGKKRVTCGSIPCNKKLVKEYYSKNKEKFQKTSREYYLNNKERLHKYKREWYLKRKRKKEDSDER